GLGRQRIALDDREALGGAAVDEEVDVVQVHGAAVAVDGEGGRAARRVLMDLALAPSLARASEAYRPRRLRRAKRCQSSIGGRCRARRELKARLVGEDL